ncbi:HAD domain-containing protein [Roseateles sp. LYH14W]
MRALFLDFDGVLHRAGNGLEDTGPMLVWLPLLADALSAYPDVLVVVHSTWRYQYSSDEIRKLLAGCLGGQPIAIAPRGPRWEAIRWFLQMNPAVASYRILDDEPDEFGHPAPDELLVCESALGLTTPGVLSALMRWLACSGGVEPV